MSNDSGLGVLPGDFGLGIGPGASIGYDCKPVTAVATVTGNATYTLQNSDATVLVTATAAGAVHLSSAVQSKGRIVTVKKVDSSANAVTLSDVAGATIDGAATLALSAQYAAATLQSDGAVWQALNVYAPA